MKHCSVPTQFGTLIITEDDGAITALRWGTVAAQESTPLLEAAAKQIAAYDAGTLRAFDLPWRVGGSDLQQAVCAQIAAIPYGETLTYGDIAKRLKVGAQAVGQACGGNPIPVIIPCHRVMGARGLTGFSGGEGVETKVALLRHEGAAGLLI
ncbi:methylated-DNA-[protein]-cysteine S-methyltransferase [Sulfitobacter brevis]|uniref:methylated-DNA--[protein]-cysteine S-methyltransferase n=1 Tax=Sulfitobacter brevis TaxID=74348 RepID=A0A1I2G5R4_9RHOB|nr:methylated-DNA--[protein]-cysteine S-methyltransferase [Sulfitobacter brevis]SFF12066.1 methylated-DNA-[protein]-cysteine S-methyltransferase [Sulfitobacter brevis]